MPQQPTTILGALRADSASERKPASGSGHWCVADSTARPSAGILRSTGGNHRRHGRYCDDDYVREDRGTSPQNRSQSPVDARHVADPKTSQAKPRRSILNPVYPVLISRTPLILTWPTGASPLGCALSRHYGGITGPLGGLSTWPALVSLKV